jgi:hypothetical protein
MNGALLDAVHAQPAPTETEIVNSAPAAGIAPEGMSPTVKLHDGLGVGDGVGAPGLLSLQDIAATATATKTAMRRGIGTNRAISVPPRAQVENAYPNRRALKNSSPNREVLRGTTRQP